MLTGILISFAALAVGIGIGVVWVGQQNRQRLVGAAAEAQVILKRSAAQVEARMREAGTQAREAGLALRQQIEAVLEADEDRISASEAAVAELAEVVAAAAESLEQAEAAFEERAEAASAALDRARSIRGEDKATRKKAQQLLEEIAGQTAEVFRNKVADGLIEQARAEAADLLRHLETDAGPETIRQAKRIVGIAIARSDRRYQAERQSYTLDVDPARRAAFEGPDQEILARVEERTGVTLSWQSDGTSLRVESGDGVSRVMARRVLSKLLKHSQPTLEVAEKTLDAAEKAIGQEIGDLGRKAFKLLGLKPAKPEVNDLVGRLYFRTSYTQNQWEHAVEAAYLGGLMASELGLNVKIARRATLLHDIGKALTHQVEGSHALIGAEIARKAGENPLVCNAIAAHHDEEAPSSIYALLVIAADAISGARPGARRELVETYTERIAELESLAAGFRGVTQVHAVQAGREIRVMVDEARVDDQRAAELATDIARKIGESLTFPGQILVTVIREFSAVEIAS